jgi:hypothetical protein
MKVLILFLLLNLLASALRGETQANNGKATLIIGTYNAFEMFDETYKPLLKQAINKAGFDVDFILYPEKRSVSYANTALIDGDIYRNTLVTESYKNLVAIPDVIRKTDYFSIIKATQPCVNSETLKQLKPVGVLGVDYFNEIYAVSEVGYEQGSSVEQVIEMLLRERADYSVAPDHSIEQIVSMSQHALKACREQVLMSRFSYTYLHKKHADKIDLIAAELKKLRIKLTAQPVNTK